MPFGPIQMLAIKFEGSRFTGAILPELRRLREAGVIRLIDLLVVRKTEEGDVESIETSDLGLDEREELGAIAGALFGLGAGGADGAEAGAILGAAAAEEGGTRYDPAEVVDIAEGIAPGDTLAIVLLEHHWAIPLQSAIREAGGQAIAESWIRPEDLVLLGAEASAALAELETD